MTVYENAREASAENTVRTELVFWGYPETTLAQTREQYRLARKFLAAGADPARARRNDKRQAKLAAFHSFEVGAKEWFTKHMAGRSESHKKTDLESTGGRLFPWLGGRLVSEIKTPEILELECLRRIEARGATETAPRAAFSLCLFRRPSSKDHAWPQLERAPICRARLLLLPRLTVINESK